jgi:LacI family transcriptional regulator
MASSIKDVALRAGVALGTVSNVLNYPDRVSKATIEKVTKAIEELDYVRNDAARQLRAGQSRAIGLIVLYAINPFFADIARGVEETALGFGFSVLMGNSAGDTTREDRYIELFEEQRVKGLLISPFGNVEDKLLKLKKSGIDSVLVDRVSENNDFSSVSVDDAAGGTMATKHLMDMGRTRIAFVGGPLIIPQVSDRLKGANRILNTVSKKVVVFETSSLSVLEGRRVGTEIASMPKSQRPDGIFAANDLVALGLLQALVVTAGIKVPEEVSIIGYDDIGYSSSAIVPLTSISQPSEIMGSTAINLLLQASQGAMEAQQVVFQPTLVKRQST